MIRAAAQDHQGLRVHGARHSEPFVIGTDAFQRGQPAYDLALDRLRHLEIDAPRRRVRVEAGCRLGEDPRVPALDATWDRSLNLALDRAGLALPNLGGITHQTVGGFLMTGSAGGSVMHGIGEAIRGFRVLDGRGQLHRLTPEDPDFWALGVSGGLLGVLTEVELSCIDRYDVTSEEQAVDGTRLPFDRMADGAAGLEGYLRGQEYARLLWWPQPGVDRWVLWTGSRAQVDPGARRPYFAFPPMLGSTRIPQAAAGWALGMIAEEPAWLGSSLRTFLYKNFVPLDPEPRKYRDIWWRALPMDNDIDERYLPTRFTEIWLPLEASGEVLRRLQRAMETQGMSAAGTFALEIYAAGKSPFWGSPGFGRDSLRLNWFWFDRSPRDPVEQFFPQFWRLFEDLEPRYHWGKLMPKSGPRPWPALAKLLERRPHYDPEGIFLTGPWKARLGLGPPVAERLAPIVDSELEPLAYGLGPSDLGLLERGSRRIDVAVEIEAPAETAYDLFANLERNGEFVPGFERLEHWTPHLAPERQRFREHFSFMTVDVRMLEAQRPQRWAAEITASSLPLAKEAVEVLDFLPLDRHRCQVRWRVAFESLPEVAWAEGALIPLLRAWFEASLKGLKRVLESERR